MIRIRTLTVRQRIWVLAGIAAAGMAAIVLVASGAMEDRIMTERREAVRQVVESAVGVVESYVALAESGAMTEQEAQAAAAETLRTMRYSGEEYFWINDMQPVMIMHPFKPELENTDLSDIQDPDGKNLFVSFVETVDAGGAGFVDYQWPKPGVEEPQPKVSYVAGIEPWGWIVGSGVYVDDVAATARAETTRLLWIGLAVIVLSGGLAYVVGRSVAAGINRAATVLGSGDLSTRLPEGGRRTELERLAVALNQTLDASQATADRVSAAIGDLDSSASRLLTAADAMTQDAHTSAARTVEAGQTAQGVSSGIDTVAAATQQMGASIAEIAENAQRVSRMAQDAVAAAEATNRTVAALGTSSTEIGDVVEVITAIAGQTNLLALNATIEAARAGEAGAGFAVVAGEVKDLAQETAKATGSIAERVEAIQTTVTEAIAQIGEISTVISHIYDYQSTIAGAVEEQTATTSEMAQSTERVAQGGRDMSAVIEEVGGLARRTSDELASIRDAAAELARTSASLHEAVATSQASA